MENMYIDLYLASDLATLEQFANLQSIGPKPSNFNQYTSLLQSLFKQSQSTPLDQEKTYIFLRRYAVLYDNFMWFMKNDNFVFIRYGQEYKRVCYQLNEYREMLEARYRKNALLNESKSHPNTPRDQRLFQEVFITTKQLYQTLKEVQNILVVDVRPEEQFKQSHISICTTINIPERLLTSNISANLIGHKLDYEEKEIWNNRDQYRAVILMDTKSTRINMSMPIERLHKAIVEWDLNSYYNEPPVIVDGGYLEFVENFPTACSDCSMVLAYKNKELDELLYIDDFTYPTDGQPLVAAEATNHHETGVAADEFGIRDQKRTVILPFDSRQHLSKRLETISETWKGDKDLTNLETTNRWDLLDKCLCIAETKRDLLKRLFNKEREWKLFKEDAKRHVVNEQIMKIEKQIEECTDEQAKYKRQFDMSAEFDPFSMAADDKVSAKYNTFCKMEEEERERLEAYELLAIERIKTYNINRSNKPQPEFNIRGKPKELYHPFQTVHQLVDSEFPGRTGLRNIRNTCYMNAAVQCFANLPCIRRFFCSGEYKSHLKVERPAILIETAVLVRTLWTSKCNSSITPFSFYNRVCELQSSYKRGNHEDCLEFLMFLLNHLINDSSWPVPTPEMPAPRIKNWLEQFNGRDSFFIQKFYYQMQITQECTICQRTSIRHEVENAFMLPMVGYKDNPNMQFHVDALFQHYISDGLNDEQQCSACKQPVHNSKKLVRLPEVLVIQLKRYSIVESARQTVVKITNECHFSPAMTLNDKTYQLQCIAMHVGDLSKGHYTAACLTRDGWYEFNDDRVEPIDMSSSAVRSKAYSFFYTL